MRSIKSKIMLAVILCSLFSVFLVGVSSVYISKGMLERNAFKQAKLLAESEAKELNMTTNQIETSVNNLAYSVVSMLDDVESFKQDPKYVAAFQERIRPIAAGIADNTNGAMAFYVRFNPTYTKPTSGLFHADAEGDGKIEQLVPTDFSQYDPEDTEHVGWYYLPIKAGEPIWLDPYHNKNIGVDMISYVVPLFKDGEEIGVVGMDINFDLFLKAVEGIKPYKDSYGALLNAQHNFLIHPQLEKTENLNNMNGELAKAITANKEGVTEASIKDKDSIISYAALSNGYTLLISAAKQDIYKDIDQLTKTIFLIFAAVMIVAVFIAFLVGKSITKPLNLLVADMQKVRDGDLTVRAKVKNNDEVGIIAENFNEMVHQLGSLTKSIQSVSASISSSSLLLQTISEEVTSSTEEVTASVEEIAEGNQAQSVSTEKCADITSQLSNKFDTLLLNSNDVLQTVDRMASENGNGMNVLKGLEEKNIESEKATQHTEKAVLELNRKTQDIRDIIETISAIADQTNLLALNASIESARAGEYGKGFSVVSEEIRKLADQTRKATDHIKEIMHSVLEDADNTVHAMKDVKEMTSRQSESVIDVSKAFRSMSDSIEKIIEKIHLNGDYISELHEDAAQLVTEVESISAVSEESAASSRQVAVSMQEQARDFEKILLSVDEMNQLVQHLNELVVKFRI